MTNFCKTYSSSSDLRSKSDSYQETIVRRAYDSYDACVRIASEGYYVTHSITARDRAQILLRASVGKPIEVTGVDTTENISCYGPDGAGKKIEYNAWTGSKSDENIGIFCSRKSRNGLGGTTVFDEGSVQIALKGEIYNFYWPKSEIIPDNVASDVQASIEELKESQGQMKARIDDEHIDVITQKFDLPPAAVRVGEIACPPPGSNQTVHALNGGAYLDEPDTRNASMYQSESFPLNIENNRWRYKFQNGAGTGMGHPQGHFAAFIVCSTSAK